MAFAQLGMILLLVFLTPEASTTDFITDTETPSAGEIMDRCVARAEAQQKSLEETNFKSNSITKNQKFDGEGVITEMKVLRHLQYPLNGAVFEELVEINGNPLSDKERKEEEERKKNFIREIEKRRARGDYIQPGKDQAVRFDGDFVSRYQYELVAEENVRSYRCWVIDFKPKEGDLPVSRTMDRALNQLNGRIWVARKDYGLVRVEFAIQNPFKYWGGLLAVIRKTDGSVDYERVEQNVWLPSQFDIMLDIRIMLLKNIRQRITKNWYDYVRVRMKSDSEAGSSAVTAPCLLFPKEETRVFSVCKSPVLTDSGEHRYIQFPFQWVNFALH